jgi:lysophospholipase L1-like esterase
MDRWLTRTARVVGTAAGAFAGLAAVQFVRLRRMEFLPAHPGFYINHVVAPSTRPGGGRRLRLAVLGDSTTAGVGVDRPEDALPHLLAQRIADAEGRSVQVVSFGWAGARVADLAPKQVPHAMQPLRHGEEPFLPGADIIAIVIGSNDATHRTRPRRFRAEMRATLEQVRRVAPRARMVVAGIPDFRGALREIEPLIFLTNQYARLLRPISRSEATRANASYADLAAEVPDRIVGRTDVLSRDQFHPSVVGYAAWADVIADALARGPETPGAGALEPVGA